MKTRRNFPFPYAALYTSFSITYWSYVNRCQQGLLAFLRTIIFRSGLRVCDNLSHEWTLYYLTFGSAGSLICKPYSLSNFLVIQIVQRTACQHPLCEQHRTWHSQPDLNYCHVHGGQCPKTTGLVCRDTVLFIDAVWISAPVMTFPRPRVAWGGGWELVMIIATKWRHTPASSTHHSKPGLFVSDIRGGVYLLFKMHWVFFKGNFDEQLQGKPVAAFQIMWPVVGCLTVSLIYQCDCMHVELKDAKMLQGILF